MEVEDEFAHLTGLLDSGELEINDQPPAPVAPVVTDIQQEEDLDLNAQNQKEPEPPKQTEPEEPAQEEDKIDQFYTAITSTLGLELTEEELANIDLADDATTVANITAALVTKAREDAVQQYVSQYPELESVIAHLEAHGTLDNFNRTEEYVPTYDLSSDQGLRDVYSDYLRAQGIDNDEVVALVNLAEDTGKLKDKAVIAKNHFDTKAEEAKLAQDAQNKAIVEQRKAEAEALVKDVRNVISGGKVLGVSLSNTDKQLLDEYLFKVDKDGKTAKDRADESLTLEQELYIELLKAKGFKNIVPGVDPVRRSVKDALARNKDRQSPTGVSRSGDDVEMRIGSDSNIDYAYLERFNRGEVQ